MNTLRWSIALASSVLSLGAPSLVAAPAKPGASKPAVKPPLIVQGRIVAVTKMPRPGSVPYKDAVIALRLSVSKVVQGRLSAREVVVYAWGMRRNTRTKAASYRAGQSIRLALTPWERVEGKYGSYNRIELPGDDAYALDSYWSEIQ